MKFKIYRQYGSLNSGPIFDHLARGIKILGHDIVDHGEDVAVIWSVLWAGRMLGNQQVYKQEIYDNFHPLPVKEAPLFSEEMCGLAALECLKDTLYKDEDPSQVYYKENTIRIVQNDQDYSLELYLPGIPKEQIQLNKTGDELNIRIGNHRRNLVLPQALAALTPAGAKMEEDYLKIRFADMAKV